MKAYCEDGLYFAYYGNDTTNTRTYKLSMTSINAWLNGGNQDFNFVLQQAMFYPNSYLNFNSNGYYTKHYYNGTERIASRLGDQNLPINVNDPDLQDRKDWQDSLIRKNVTEITGYEFLPVGEEQNPEDPKPIFELPQVAMTGLQPIGGGSVYYYHSNHLGSTCYVTDENRSVVQGFLYAPFGEITNEHNSSFGSSVIPKYSFNAKELDEETGFYYYEARYYNPPTFISRDPLFEKYPMFSPYAYCANNPVKYVDPDGREIDEATVNDNILNLVRTNKEFAKVYNQLKDDKTTVFKFFQMDRYYKGAAGIIQLTEMGDGINKKDVVTIYYSWDFEKDLQQSPERILCEEVYHAKQFLDGNIGFGFEEKANGEKEHIMLGYDKYDEKDAIDWSCKITGKEESIWSHYEGYYTEKTKKDGKQRPKTSAEQGFINIIPGLPDYYSNGVAIGHHENISVTIRKPK